MFSNYMFCMQIYSVYHQIKHKTMQQILTIEEMELGYLAFFFFRKDTEGLFIVCYVYSIYDTLPKKNFLFLDNNRLLY